MNDDNKFGDDESYKESFFTMEEFELLMRHKAKHERKGAETDDTKQDDAENGPSGSRRPVETLRANNFLDLTSMFLNPNFFMPTALENNNEPNPLLENRFFNFDVDLLNAGINTIPLYKQLKYPASWFTKDQLDTMNQEAELAQMSYENLLNERKNWSVLKMENMPRTATTNDDDDEDDYYYDDDD